jgi:hypothetical protein
VRIHFTPREALIPVIDASSGGSVARIAADGELPVPHAAQLDRSLVELLENGLYQAGQTAKSAARLCPLPGRGWLARAGEALHVVNPGDVIGLGAENANSAELGLALALLMFRAQTDQRAVIASGALDLNSGGREIPVLPIHHLAGKLRLVERHFSQPGSAPAPRHCLIPTLDPDGVATIGRYVEETQALKVLGIEVRSVSTLAEAAQCVGARRVAVTPAERRLRRMLIAAPAILLAALALRYGFNAPIAMSFVPLANADGSIIATPARQAARRASSSEFLQPCRVDGSLPAFSVGERIAVRLRTGSQQDRSHWFGGYHHALVSISGSGVKVLPPPTAIPVAAGADTGYLLDVREPEEETLLVWLAKRGAPFDTAALESQLRRQLQRLEPGERISAARNLLQSAAPGVLLYSFRSVSPESCR